MSRNPFIQIKSSSTNQELGWTIDAPSTRFGLKRTASPKALLKRSPVLPAMPSPASTPSTPPPTPIPAEPPVATTPTPKPVRKAIKRVKEKAIATSAQSSSSPTQTQRPNPTSSQPTKPAQPPVRAARAVVPQKSGSAKKARPSTAPQPRTLAPTATQPLPAPRRKQRSPSIWKWSSLWFIGLSLSGSVGVVGLLWLMALPPLPDCDRISVVSPDRDQLFCAREAARSGELTALTAGIELVQDWSESHPLYAEAQDLLAAWSRHLLAIAQQRYENTDFRGAVDIASTIPKTSRFYEDAQATIAQWQEEWKQGEAIYATAQEALKNQEWGYASEQILALGQIDNPYWRERQMTALTNQIFAERSAGQTLRQARRLAKQGGAVKLGEAIALAIQVNPQTYVWQDAKADVKTWSDTLLKVALKQWQTGDTRSAMQLAQHVPADLELAPDAQALVIVSHAQALAQWDATTQWAPSQLQVWNLREAIAAMQRIPSNSAFYSQAQTAIQDWQAQLQDLKQLQVANAIASLGQRSTLELAIQQASQISPERPRRLQAQTLIAHWGQEIQRIEDMPFMNRAYALAKTATVGNLQAAIQAAKQVPQGRALWDEAQGAIAQWIRQLQTIEDQPILDRATQMAKQGNLRDAIREAQTIERGRALYDQATAAIDGWQAEINRVLIAEDRKILDEARALAAQQRLTQAIEVASRIGSNRPLSGEAQEAIAQWRAERDSYWNSWDSQADPEVAEPDYSDPVEPEPPEPVYDPAYDAGYDTAE